MQQNLIKIPAITQLDAKLWEDGLRDATLRVASRFQLWTSPFFFECWDTVEHARCLLFYTPATLIVFLSFFFTFLMALSSLFTAMKQTEPGKCSSQDVLCHVGSSNMDFLICTRQCTVDYSQAIPFCIWFCARACPHLATSAAATSLKWLETWDNIGRNRGSWILMLLSAGFCCACCCDFAGQHCSYLLV